MPIDPVRIDHVELARSRVPAYLRDLPRYGELLDALARPCQLLEDAALAVYAQRALDAAEGAQLDQLGALVKEPRAGLSDVAYRRRIRARIAADNSQGLTEDLIRVARLIVYDPAATITTEQQDVATEIVRIGAIATDDATAADLISFARTTVSAGVRVIAESSPAAPAATFTFDTGGLGFPTPYTLAMVNYLDTGFDTVLGVRQSAIDNDESSATSFTLQFIANAGAPDAGTYVDTWPSLSFTFKPGTTTMRAFELTIASSSSWIYVVTKSTVTGELQSGDDEFGPLAFNNWDPAIDGGVFARGDD